MVSALGITNVQGKDVFVDVLVLVRPGQNSEEAVRAGLESQGARPLKEAQLGSGGGFSLIGPVWDFSAAVPQHYNGSGEPLNSNSEPINAKDALSDTQALWEAVPETNVDLDLAADTTRCPSLIRKCSGPQFFDGNNDVGWVNLGINRGFIILGATLFAEGNSGLEADMALSTNSRIDWINSAGATGSQIDVVALFLHELGHVLGLGHSMDPDAVMFSGYTNPPEQSLDQDDKEGIIFLYDATVNGSITGTVIDDADGTTPIEGATVILEGTELEDTTDASGYSIAGVPDPVTYDVTVSADGFDSSTFRLEINGATNHNFTLTASNGGDGNGGGGVCPPAREAMGKC